MATLANANRTGYTNQYGKPIGNNIDQWFEYGVKSTEEHVEREGISSTKQTLYMLLFIIGFIILAIIIIVPVAVGIATKH